MATIAAIIRGDLRKQLAAEARTIRVASRRGLVRATAGVRNDIRRAIRVAGFSGGGRGMAKAVVSKIRSESDRNLVGVVRSRAIVRGIDLVGVFAEGVTVTAGGGKYLAIPTGNAPLKSGRGRGKAMSPAEARASGVRTAFLRTAAGGVIVSIAKGRKPVVLYVLRRRVMLRQRYSIDGIVTKWRAELPRLLAENLGD